MNSRAQFFINDPNTKPVRAARARQLLAVIAVFLAGLGSQLQADVLDDAVIEDAFLGTVAEALAAYGIDVTSNLNARDVVRQRLQQPRLGRFPDLPQNRLPYSEEIVQFETEYQDQQLAALAILAEQDGGKSSSSEAFIERWLAADSLHRVFIIFDRTDLDSAAKIQQVGAGYFGDTLLLTDVGQWETAGRLYSSAAQRLALDTREARRNKSAVTEMTYLGERVRRNSDSLFKGDGNLGDSALARNEPSVFLKVFLGDEFTQSTIREIIVPGGVALGETARLPLQMKAMVFEAEQLHLLDTQGNRWQLPAIEASAAKALFDFANRAQAIGSDAMVDIDGEGRVRITSALRDTDAGFDILHADTQPFKYVDNLPVTKSVIIDTQVVWSPTETDNTLQFETEFEVRFLSADNMRIAQTRVALQYEYQSPDAVAKYGAVTYIDAWGRESRRLDENLDYTGLGNSVAVVADFAGWIGLFRKLEDDGVPFLQGRYEFMKLDKSGRSTPSRY